MDIVTNTVAFTSYSGAWRAAIRGGKKHLCQNNGKYGQIGCLLLMRFPDIDNPYVILSAHSVWEPTITEQTHCQVQTVGYRREGDFSVKEYSLFTIPRTRTTIFSI